MYAQDCEQLTLFPADSHASPSPWLESKKAGTMSAICGLKCCELSENLRRVGLSVRTYLESCELPPGTWSRTWSAKVMTSRCLILRLRLSERRTDGQGSLLWQTPNVPNGGRVNPPDMTETGKMPDGRKRQVGLEHQVKMAEAGLWRTPGAQDLDGRGTYATEEALRKRLVNGHQLRLTDQVKFQGMWPTPRAKEDCDYQYSAGRKGHKVLTLSGKVKLWPTATARDYKGSNSLEHMTRETGHMNHTRQLANAVKLYPTPRAQSANGQADPPNRQWGADLQSMDGGQLNPTWVEWLMGYPLGWTELNASETP